MDELLAYNNNNKLFSFSFEHIFNAYMFWMRAKAWERKWTGKKCFQLYKEFLLSTKSRNKSENFCRNSILQNYEFGHEKDIVCFFSFVFFSLQHIHYVSKYYYYTTIKRFDGEIAILKEFYQQFSTKIIRILIQTAKRSKPQQI